ncbi:T9SS type A sorting domain-containing protein [Hymenobacter rubripertinctus]|uniref:T9SS C-terminal target domain-containing protein n=1 Tax=Hymenobacter rubripertinctus TaxID=2029981 RepID=A0A418QVK4_9BACT|nr:T9SS type A sorting domain-containing protein [Hymenobacter rubripertinctus]RIY09227.1 T9SS C-terminal target domain-containing protein [Hymenobacter rubripertinctus]
MKNFFLICLLLGIAPQVRAQFPTNSFAVRSECPGSANNPSVLEIINTDGSLTLIDTIRDGSARPVLNALGNDAQDRDNLYALSVVQPVTLANFNTPPNLYRVSLTSAQATNLGQVLPPPASPGGGFGIVQYRQTLNFIGDGDNTSSYFVGGVSFNYSLFTGLISDFRFYVGQVQLNPFTSAAPTWRLLDVSDPATAALIAQFALQTQAYISSGFNGPAPEGGIQDWVFDPGSDQLLSYAGQDDKFIAISGIRSSPVAVTTTPTTPIPATQDIGSMFTDRFGGVYAVNAQDGTIYKIDRLTGNWTGQTFGSALGCNRGDAVSFPDALPLPVTLVRFEVKLSGPAVRLSWATASEQEAAYFEVERSATGRSWQPVARVAAGNQPHGQQYTATDARPLAGLAYYRLAMHDRDGKVAYSSVQTLAQATTLVVYPNPARDKVEVILANSEQAATLDLLTAQGRVVRHLQTPGGSTHASLRTAGLPGGVYLLRVQQAGTSFTSRLVVVGQ